MDESVCLRVGLDMSLVSPAVAAQFSDHRRIYILSFQQRKTDEELRSVAVGEDMVVSRLAYPLDEENRWSRCHHIITHIIAWINHLQQSRPGCEVKCFIEHYALGIVGSDSVSKLCELGGILRHQLHLKGWSFVELSPSTVKKHFANNGHASKEEMYATYEALGLPDLRNVLRCMSHQHPLEDIVDSVAVLFTGFEPPAKPKPTKKRKLKPQ